MKRLAAILMVALLLMGMIARAENIPQTQFVTQNELMELAANTNNGQGLLATGTDTDVKLPLILGSRGESITYYKAGYSEATVQPGPLVWWVAGAENENSLVLLTREPLLGMMAFQQSANNQIFYGNPGTQEVYANHWGASALRRALYSARPFTAAEQNLTQVTTTTTYDMKNSADYTTTDRLYAPAGKYDDDKYITLGRQDQLKVNMAHWSGRFWLRSPFSQGSHYALSVLPGYYVHYDPVNEGTGAAAAAAVRLDVSGVLFASAASGNGTGRQAIAAEAPLTLRLDGAQENMGSAWVTEDQTVAWAENAQGSRLMVQGNGFSYAQPINSNDTVTLAAENVGAESFADCKVWLEKDMPDGGSLTWAVMAGKKDLPAPAPTPTPTLPPPPAPIPETGDSAAPVLWLGLMLTGGLLLILMKKKRA